MKGVALVIFVWGFLLCGCMDFGWKSGQFSCDGDGQCPSGFYCDPDQGVCVEGAGTDLDTDTDADTDSDTDADTDTDSDSDSDSDTDTDTGECQGTDDCPQPECGSIYECDENNQCVYDASGTPCEYSGGECDTGICMQDSTGEEPYCEFEKDWHECDSGDICLGDSGAFLCGAGGCASGALSTEQRLTNNPGESAHFSVVATSAGFSAVWIDDISSNYGNMYFAMFNPNGTVSLVKQIGSTGNFEFPSLAWLGSGSGYVVAFQRWVGSAHEVMMGYLDSDGDFTGTPTQISDGNAIHSRYPHVAVGDFGSSSRIAVVWMDERNSGYEHDVYSSVFNQVTGVLISGNQRVFDDTREEVWPKVVATGNSFVVAVTAYEDVGGSTQGEVLTRQLSSEGIPLGSGYNTVTPVGSAMPPADIAWNASADRIGLAWRDRREAGKNRVMFRLLGPAGQTLGSLDNGVVVGPSHDALVSNGLSLNPLSASNSFLLAWDGHLSNWLGPESTADVMLSQVRWNGNAADVSDAEVDSAFIICDDPARSVWPRAAHLNDITLVLWQDNREDNAAVSDGEVYGAAVDCQ